MTQASLTQPPDITHLLIVAGGNDAANRLISGLRGAGLALRAANAGTEQELAALVMQNQWDVLVCYDDARLSLHSILGVLQRFEQDIPVLVVSTADPLPLFEQGVCEVLKPEQDLQLLMSVRREAAHYQLKRQLRALEIRHRELEKRHELILAGSDTALAYVQDGVHLYCNRSYADRFAYDGIEAVTTVPLLNLVNADERARMKALLAQARNEEQSGTFHSHRQDGSEEPVQFTFTPVEYLGKPCLQVSVKAAGGNSEYASSVARMGTQDLLTRLDNRAHFLTRIETAIRNAVQQGVYSSLLVVEMNEFGDISSAIGKSSANIVLNDIARFLREAITGPYAVARLDEHQFGILLYDGDPDAALALAAEIRGRINNRISPAMLTSLELGCSIGMALINGHALDAEAVLERANSNLGDSPAATDSSRYQFRIGDSLRHDAGDMLEYLKAALQQQRFKLLFQPLVPISDVNDKAYEVLTRMLDDDGNEVSPAAFLPLANLNGVGEDIDKLVIGMALDSVQGSNTAERLIVNVTSNTLMSRTFLPWLSDKLRAGRIPADLLMLQFSEVDLHNSPTQVLAFCKGLRELNVRIAISHFGCALDPFSLLDTSGAEIVKLDETVVRDILYSTQQKTNVQRLIQNLHNRGLLVIAPQVEDMDVLPVLWEAGTDFVQGYCLQRPSDEMNYEFVQVEEITLSAPQN
jgi:diguanylate cyclase (GGDEF)-like protein